MRALVSCILFFWVLFSTDFLLADSPEKTRDKILVISSYNPLKEKGSRIITSFEECFVGKSTLSITVEYMDSESFPEFENWTSWLQSLFLAYEEPPRAVVILGGEAWSVYRENCIDSWKEVPVILGGVKRGYIDYRKKKRQPILDMNEISPTVSTFGGYRVTGYYIVDYIAENLSFIKKMQPEISDVVFCYDDRYHHIFFESYLQELVKQSATGLRLHYLPGSRFSTADLLDSLAVSGKQTAWLTAGWYTDVKYYSHAYVMFHNELMRYPDRFLYEVQELNYEDPNYLGGYFVSGQEIGCDLATLTLEVLQKGIENSTSFRITPSAPAYHLNYKEFMRAGLDKSKLPENVVWYNVEPSLFDTYPAEMTFIVMLILLAVMAALFSFVYRRHRIRSYEAANRNMKQLLEAIPEMGIIFTEGGTIENILNPSRGLSHLCSKAYFIGKSMEEIAIDNPALKEAALSIGRFVKMTFQDREVHTFSYQVKNEGKIHYADARVVPFGEDKVIFFGHDVTELIDAEQEIFKWKNFLQSVIDHLPVGIFVKDASDNFKYIYYNRRICDFYGNIPETFLEKNDYETRDPLAKEYRREDEEVLKSDKPITYERTITDLQGNLKFGITTKTSLVNNDGSRYIIAILVDMTQTRKNERELKNIRNELAIALDAGSMSAWIYNVDKRLFSSLYKETVAHSGLSYEEVCRILHPEDKDRYEAFMEDLVAGRFEKKKEILRFFREGRYDWYETHAIGIRDMKTGQIYQVVGTEKNITEELEMQRRLEESKFKTDLVIKSNGIKLWDYDVKTGVFSSSLESSFMYRPLSREEFFSQIYPEDIPLAENAINEMIGNKMKTLNIQIRLKLWQIGWRWMDIHAVAFQWDEKGELTQITGLCQDITERKQVTEELVKLRDKAEEANRLKTAFLANMSHEIRTPLNAIVGFSNLIAHTGDPEEREEYSRIIETNNELLLQLVNDILDLSKIEAGQLDFVYSEVDLNAVFKDIEHMYHSRLKEGVRLVCEIPDGEWMIYSEKNRLTQVISNFLSNAAKFTSEGKIVMGFEPISQGLRFYVKDTGKGIAPENVPHVFERFTKFDSFVQGTGLGLSICHMIVKRLGGEIGVDSKLGEGTVFWFTLPVEPRQLPEKTVLEPAVVSVNRKPEEKVQEQKKILIAEDNDSNYLLLATLLKKEYYLLRAQHGEEAVNLFRSESWDLILMDIKMPGMDGLEATRKIREADQEIPIIALTANAFNEDRENALKAGCTDYLSKPVDRKLLQELLDRYLS